MNKYESVVIINPTVDEEGMKALISKFTDLINNDGKVEKVDILGKKKLAYEVKIGMYSPDTHPGIITAHQSYKKVYDDVQRGVNTYWLSKPLHVGFSN